jgi:hypothetical protein
MSSLPDDPGKEDRPQGHEAPAAERMATCEECGYPACEGTHMVRPPVGVVLDAYGHVLGGQAAPSAREARDRVRAETIAAAIRQTLIAKWGSDSRLAIGFAYRRMASDAAEAVLAALSPDPSIQSGQDTNR